MQPHSPTYAPAASPNPRETAFAWLELARLSNLPTVLTNILVGIAAAATSPEMLGERFAWRAVLPLLLALALLYAGGMILNDVTDAHIDARERPRRPIPSGRVRSNQALLVSIGCLLGGTFLLILIGVEPPLALALPAAIIAYDLAHDRFAASALFMGACRGLVYLVAAAAVAGEIPSVAWLLGGLLATYTTVVTLLSQKEVGAPGVGRRVLSLVPPLLALPALIVINGHERETFTLSVAGLVMLAWLTRAPMFVLDDPPRMKAAILTLLSGMCLVDAFFLAALGAPMMALLLAAGCFVLTVLLHRRISGT